MRLYLVQHGEAVSKEVNPDRPLSDNGRRDVERLAAFLAKCGVQVACVVHSGKTRATQTAGLIAAALAPGREVQMLQGLGPEDPAQPLANQIGSWMSDKLVVGHLPQLGRLVSWLVVGNQDHDIVSLRPGSAVCLEREEGASHWRLLWMLRPGMLSG